MSLPTSRAYLARLLPCLRSADIRIPEGPGPALPWPIFVHFAAPRFIVEEYAVAIFELHQALSHANLADIRLFEIGDRKTKPQCQCGNLALVHPYEPWRAGAAIAALRAFESQSVFEPG